jgi:hypothetical protein
MSLPSHLSEETFRFYEPYIAEAVRAGVVVIAPDRLDRSLSTVTARVRDAMASLEQNDWNTYIDRQAFDSLRATRKLIVRTEKLRGKYYCVVGVGTAEPFTPDAPVSRREELHIPAGSDEEIYAAVFLLKLNNILSMPVRAVRAPDHFNQALLDSEWNFLTEGEDTIML